MKTAVAAGATLTAASYSRVLGSNERISTGFIGIGNRGESLLKETVANCPGAQVTALCDVYQPYLDNARQHAAEAPTHSDYRKLLESKDVDAVVIATPDHWHAKQFVDACDAGKDVYVEKPLTLVVAEGPPMIKAAREHNRVTQMGAQRHSAPYIIEACKRMREGAIGRITYVRCFHIANEFPNGVGKMVNSDPPAGLDWDMWLGPAPWIDFHEVIWNYKFRWFWEYSGGQMTNFGTHWLDVIHMGIGQEIPRAVTALGGNYAVEDDRSVPDTMTALWEYENCLVEFTQINANSAPGSLPGVQIEFRGSNGTLYIYGDRYEIIPEGIQASDYPSRGPLNRDARIEYKTTIEKEVVKGSLVHSDHLNNFFDCVKSREKCNLDVETGHRSTVATHVGNIALRAKGWLSWDGEAEKFTNNREANSYLSYKYRKPWKL